MYYKFSRREGKHEKLKNIFCGSWYWLNEFFPSFLFIASDKRLKQEEENLHNYDESIFFPQSFSKAEDF